MRSKVEIGTVKNPKSVNLTGYRLSPTKTVFPHASFGFNPGKRSYLPNLNFYEPVSARHYAKELTNSKVFTRWVKKKREEFFPLAVVPPAVSKALNTNGHTVLLSRQTFIKKKEKHPDLKLANYRSLQNDIDNSRKFSNKNNVAIVYENSKKKKFVAMLKSVENTDEIFLRTLHRVDDGTINGFENRWKEIKE